MVGREGGSTPQIAKVRVPRGGGTIAHDIVVEDGLLRKKSLPGAWELEHLTVSIRYVKL